MMADDPEHSSGPTRVTAAGPQGSANIPYLIVLKGLQVGSIFRATGELVIGRDVDAQVRLVDLNVSRRHARLAAEGSRVFIEDLGSSNGTLVNKQPFTSRVELQDGDTISIGAATLLKFTHHDGIEEGFEEKLRDSAQRDPLTGVYRAETFDEQLQREFAYARRRQSRLALLVIDVDELSDINARWARLSGDVALAHVGRRLVRQAGEDGLVARAGGGTFVALARSLLDEQALAWGQAFKRSIAARPVPAVVGDAILVTVSVGIATFPAPGVDSSADLQAAARGALRAAKAEGGNRVRIARPR
jgi:diguanylate cyclase (GGDEF)-like protein